MSEIFSNNYSKISQLYFLQKSAEDRGSGFSQLLSIFQQSVVSGGASDEERYSSIHHAVCQDEKGG